LILESFPVGMFQCNCVILGDETTRNAVVIDPGDELEKITEILDHYKLTLTRTIHTHGHLDHIGAAGLLKEQRGALTHIHEGDLPLWEGYAKQAALFGMEARVLPRPDVLLKAGDTVEEGEIGLKVIETPGHTPGSICLSLESGSPSSSEPLLFTGDTLFRQGIGRTDLWGGDSRQLLRSIRERLLDLPEDTLVHPGHGPVTSIKDEKKANPFIDEILSA
jgi:hydroxyacylglutathione hydrolase